MISETDEQRVKRNRLVAAYRSLKLREWGIEQAEQELAAGIKTLSIEEFMEYARMTQAIDAAMDETQHIIDQSQYAASTEKQMMHAAANRVGKDMEVRS